MSSTPAPPPRLDPVLFEYPDDPPPSGLGILLILAAFGGFWFVVGGLTVGVLVWLLTH